MKTGEGKTLVATLRRLPQRPRRQGRPRRHRQRLPRPPRRRVDGPDLQFPRPDRRRHRPRPRRRPAPAAYACDITYGTNNEFGFDYLRDNMKYELATMVQRGHHFAIVDEVELDPGRRGAHAADHFRPARRPLRALHHHRQVHPRARQGRLRRRREAAHRHLHRGRQREARAHPRAKPACSRATRSTTSRTSPSSTTSTRRSAPTGCSSATRTTSSRTARWSSSTSSPAA